MIPSMEPLHISEGDLARDVRSILKRVETGGEVIVERNAQPVAVIRAVEPVRRRERRQRFLDDLLTGVPVQPITVPIALPAGLIDGLSQAKGVRIPLNHSR